MQKKRMERTLEQKLDKVRLCSSRKSEANNGGCNNETRLNQHGRIKI